MVAVALCFLMMLTNHPDFRTPLTSNYQQVRGPCSRNGAKGSTLIDLFVWGVVPARVPCRSACATLRFLVSVSFFVFLIDH